jgi:hypothetical protein
MTPANLGIPVIKEITGVGYHYSIEDEAVVKIVRVYREFSIHSGEPGRHNTSVKRAWYRVRKIDGSWLDLNPDHVFSILEVDAADAPD